MPQIRSIADLLIEHNRDHLELILNNPELNCLEANASRYSVLMFQPQGEIEYSENFVRNKNHIKAEREYRQFIELGRSKASDLVITPEYSCPWSVIEQVIREDRMPSIGKLWVVGCESITPEELYELSRRVRAQCFFIYDDDFERSAGQRFLDPVCFMFRTHSTSTNSDINVAVIQFKTAPMGDGTMRFETDNLIRGTRFYKFKNTSVNSISLICLICSDSLAYARERDHCLGIEFQNDDPSIVLHLQMNKDPRNDRFAEYRKFCLRRDHKDVICLNWAQNIKLYDNNGDGHVIDWGNASVSAIYSKSWPRKPSEDVVHNNQQKGFYLTYWDTTRACAGFINFEPHVFLLALTKVSQTNDDLAVQSPALPNVLSVFSWNQKNGVFDELPDVDGGATAAFLTADIDPRLFGDLLSMPIPLERLLLLSCGELRENRDSWPSIQSMASIRLGNEESIRRLTFVQDNCSDATDFRRRLLHHFKVFNDLRLNSERFPKRLEKFKSNHLVCEQDIAYANLKTMDGTEELAVAMYLGDQAHGSTLNELRAWLDHRLREQKAEGLRVDPSYLVIWYVRVTDGVAEVISFPEDDSLDITDGAQEPVVSITRTT